MNRKEFLKNTVSVATIPLLINGFGLRSYGQGCLFQKAIEQSSNGGRVLVLVQLDGGNDGLNTIIPIDQYAALINARKKMLIPKKKVLRLKNSSMTGFHPAMKGLQAMYNNNQMTVIQGVGYPDPIFSHFRAIDIWHTGSSAKEVLTTGWIGRFLDQQYPSFPKGYPSNAFPDPPAIQIGSVLSNVFQGSTVGMGMTISNTDIFYDLVLGKQNEIANTLYGRELAFINNIATQTKHYFESIKQAVRKQKNISPLYPAAGKNVLADQFKIVAQLIGGGLQTKVYMVSLKGFDTHNNQVSPSDPLKGIHAHLLENLSEAIVAFEDDLKRMGKLDDVLGLSYSEFGRRIMSNASNGTDHGSTGPVLLFGSKLKGGLVGKNPVIPDKVTVEDNLSLQHDFRSVYASVLQDWFKIPETEVANTLLAKYPKLDLFL